MVQKDLKIGLALGLGLVIVAVLVLATDPRLSTKARMLHLQDAMAKTKHPEGPNDDLHNQPTQLIALGGEDGRTGSTRLLPVELSKNGVAPNYSKPEDLIQGEPSRNKTTPDVLNAANPENQQIINDELSEPADVPQFVQSEKIKTQKFHIVRKDQTLSDISRIYYGSPNKWKKIFNANRNIIKDANKINPGIKLIIPD
jgi:LysM repeat protein